MKKQRVLLVEDNAMIRDGIRMLLEREGFLVDEAGDGREGLAKLQSETDIVVLDVMMPGISGIKTCEEIRKVSNVPVLFLTAKDQESDKLLGLTVGGDDYLVKPFSYGELLGRIKALLRRRNIYDHPSEQPGAAKPEWLEQSEIRIHTGRNQVFCRGEELALTDLEYRLLLLFVEYPNKIFTIENLYEAVWNAPFTYTSGNTVMVHIRRLRQKIETDPKKPTLILTVWGKGYQFGKQG